MKGHYVQAIFTLKQIVRRIIYNTLMQIWLETIGALVIHAHVMGLLPLD